MSHLQHLAELARNKGLNFRMVDWHLEVEINRQVIAVRTEKELEDI